MITNETVSRIDEAQRKATAKMEAALVALSDLVDELGLAHLYDEESALEQAIITIQMLQAGTAESGLGRIPNDAASVAEQAFKDSAEEEAEYWRYDLRRDL